MRRTASLKNPTRANLEDRQASQEQDQHEKEDHANTIPAIFILRQPTNRPEGNRTPNLPVAYTERPTFELRAYDLRGEGLEPPTSPRLTRSKSFSLAGVLYQLSYPRKRPAVESNHALPVLQAAQDVVPDDLPGVHYFNSGNELKYLRS